MTRETAEFLLGLLDRVTLSAADPDLMERAQQITTARAQLQSLAEVPPIPA